MKSQQQYNVESGGDRSLESMYRAKMGQRSPPIWCAIETGSYTKQILNLRASNESNSLHAVDSYLIARL